MALIVEIGTVVANANSYASIAYADAYHLDRGNSAWGALLTANKSAALIKATQYIDNTYRERWLGCLWSPDQPLCWPRVFAADSLAATTDLIPTGLKNAVCEAALLTLTVDLLAPTQTGVQSEKIGDIAVTYSSPSKMKYPSVSGQLSRFIRATGSIIRS